jgi:2-polyprenyl-3-methyl-5-hydroxy-6-metoxy-1,4-benzoquinol methylase
MIEKYGKFVDMNSISRDLSKKKQYIEIAENDLKKAKFKDIEESVHKCRICGSNNTKMYMRAYDSINYLECNDCQTVFMEQIPDTSKMYENSEGSAQAYLDTKAYFKRVDMIAKPKVDWICETLDVIGYDYKNSGWIDIGCGNGELLQCVKARNIKCCGIETDSSEVDFCRNQGLTCKKVFVDPDNDAEVSNILQGFNIISLFNFIEHIEEPKKLIETLYRNSGEDTIMIFEVPRHPSLASFVNSAFPNSLYRHITPPYHIHVFGENGVEKMIEGMWEIVGKWGFGQGFLDMIDAVALNSTGCDLSIYEKLSYLSNEIQKIIDCNGLSDTMIYVARKTKGTKC